MTKPTIGSSDWGVTLNNHLDSMAADIAAAAAGGGGGGGVFDLANVDRNYDSDSEYVVHGVIVDDGTTPTTWPNRISFEFGGKLIGWFNEYGEIRCQPATTNSPALRIFGKDKAVDQDHDSNQALFEVNYARDQRDNLFLVFPDGSVMTAGQIRTEIPGGPTLTAGYLALDAVEAVPAGTPAGTLIVRPA